MSLCYTNHNKLKERPSMESNTSKPAQLPIKQIKYVDAIVKGKTKRQAGLLAGASTEVAADQYSNRMSKNVNVQDALAQSLAKHNINIDSSIAPIGKALHAMKMNEFTGVITEDLGMQLKASDRALKLMGVGQGQEGPSIHFHQHIEAQKDKYGL